MVKKELIYETPRMKVYQVKPSKVLCLSTGGLDPDDYYGSGLAGDGDGIGVDDGGDLF